jgi:hypothetical protein
VGGAEHLARPTPGDIQLLEDRSLDPLNVRDEVRPYF